MGQSDHKWYRLESFNLSLKKINHADSQHIQKYNINRLHTNVWKNTLILTDPIFPLLAIHHVWKPTITFYIAKLHPNHKSQPNGEFAWIFNNRLDSITSSSCFNARTLSMDEQQGYFGWCTRRFSHYTRKLQEAFRHQTRIGWRHLIQGKVSIKWIQRIKPHIP